MYKDSKFKNKGCLQNSYENYTYIKITFKDTTKKSQKFHKFLVENAKEIGLQPTAKHRGSIRNRNSKIH